jgi:hypothetical protein
MTEQLMLYRFLIISAGFIFLGVGVFSLTPIFPTEIFCYESIFWAESNALSLWKMHLGFVAILFTAIVPIRASPTTLEQLVLSVLYPVVWVIGEATVPSITLPDGAAAGLEVLVLAVVWPMIAAVACAVGWLMTFLERRRRCPVSFQFRIAGGSVGYFMLSAFAVDYLASTACG